MIKKILFALLSLSIIGCSDPVDLEQLTISGFTQGTTYSISYVDSLHRNFKPSIDSILLDIDQSLSLWNENSLIVSLNEGDTVSPDIHLDKVIRRSVEISRETGGTFDITLAPLIRAWGFGKEKVDRPDSATVRSLLKVIGVGGIHRWKEAIYLDPGYMLDPNAIAQGYSVDVVADFLRQKGIGNYMVEIGGEVRCLGKNINDRIWRIGIDKPAEQIQADRFQAIVELPDRALATSGNYRKFWVDEQTGMKFQHTIDPVTGFPVRNNLLSVTVIGPNATDADAYATACMVMGVYKAQAFLGQREDLEALLIFSDEEGNWKEWSTEGFVNLKK
ncbi:MAG: FAD:protein FMN transferase [Bacteroidota bacterium]|nr:FAD:protein FMN transferase [Bacteroidota bacterium]